MGTDLSKEGDKSREPSSTYFGAFRFKNYWPTLYGDNRTAADTDVLQSGIIFAFAILAFSFYIILPGVRGAERFYAFVRITVSLFIGAVILLCNFGLEWDVGSVTASTQYKAAPGNINATIGLKIGLRGVNVTLKGVPDIQQRNELINYNEKFSWNPWREGRTGFGPYASAIRKDYREAQQKGAPYPILWVAEYFIQEGEGMRWGFHYKRAGWFTHIMMWTAFALWLLANILYFIMPRYGAFATINMGISMVTGNILWAAIRNSNQLMIPFGNQMLQVQYGWCFYFNLVVGIASIFLGASLILLDICKPEALATFFSMDVLKDYEEFYADDTANVGQVAKGVQHGNFELGRQHSNAPGLRKRGFSIKRKPSAATPRIILHPPEETEIAAEVTVHEGCGTLAREDIEGERCSIDLQLIRKSASCSTLDGGASNTAYEEVNESTSEIVESPHDLSSELSA